MFLWLLLFFYKMKELRRWRDIVFLILYLGYILFLLFLDK